MDQNVFKRQIEEDIQIIQDEYQNNNPNLAKKDYAFNYWVLTKLFSIDEEVVEDNITEYSDEGCDCYVFYEDSKELYIIQNKYYGLDTKLDKNLAIRDFLNRTLKVLEENMYNRSAKLQEIFNKYKGDEDFKIFLHFYITNNLRDDDLIEKFKNYRYTSEKVKCYVGANLFYLDDISEAYYGERKVEQKKFNCTFLTVNNGTCLNIDREAYHLPNLIDAKYILVPVREIYEILKQANEKGYSLFAENIREYLGMSQGKTSVNTKIANTLEDDNDRNNFFYYNNGITVICDEVKKTNSNSGNLSQGFKVNNPQIVNGCQTVNTIFEVLKKYPEVDLENKFRDVYVMVKLLKLDKDTDKELYENIVRYNNSQNAIKERDFAYNKDLFFNLQKDFKNLGFLLSVKQSDNYKFKDSERISDHRPKLTPYQGMFKLNFGAIKDIIIPLEKLLQVVLAFTEGGDEAFTHKADLSKNDSRVFSNVMNYLKKGPMTNKNLLQLYLLYLKVDKDKKASSDGRTPIPYYMIGFIGDEFKNISSESERFKNKYDYLFSNLETFEIIYKFYKEVTKRYAQKIKNDGIEYNNMIKRPIDRSKLMVTINDEIENIDEKSRKEVILKFRSI